MTQITLSDFHPSSESVTQKIGSAACGVCIYAWGAIGLAVIAGLVAKLLGLI